MVNVSSSKFGEMPDGSPVQQFTLVNANGLVCKAINYGAIITEVHVPDRNGALADIVLGFDNLKQYLDDRASIGATIGRVINRIAGGTFTLDGRTYALAQNNGANHLHGGVKGFGKVLWKAEPLDLKNSAAVKFTRTSPDGEENYPGTLQATLVCALTDDNELRLDYEAVTDKPTPVSLSNHSYWNLAGGGDVLGHELMIAAHFFTPADDNKIPTGEIKSVAGTPLDFTASKLVGRDIAQLADSRGYDHNFVLDGGGGKLALAARVYEPRSGRVMEVLTDQPAVQLYTANYLKDTPGKRGQLYRQHHAVCLETQHFPDSVHHAHFPSVILRPGEIYRTTTVHRFSTR